VETPGCDTVFPRKQDGSHGRGKKTWKIYQMCHTNSLLFLYKDSDQINLLIILLLIIKWYQSRYF